MAKKKASSNKRSAKKKTVKKPTKKVATSKKSPAKKPSDKKGDEEQKKDSDKARKKDAMTDYNRLLDEVRAMKIMTDTKAWQDHYAYMKKQMAEHGKAILVDEKTRDMVRHQEAVKIYQDLIAHAQGPIDRLDQFINEMTLFSSGMTERAEWNAGTGRVDIKVI